VLKHKTQSPVLSPYRVHRSIWTLKTINRRGASAARRAHNPEVTGSTPVAGIFQFVRFIEMDRHSLRDVKQRLTGVAHNHEDVGA